MCNAPCCWCGKAECLGSCGGPATFWDVLEEYDEPVDAALGLLADGYEVAEVAEALKTVGARCSMEPTPCQRWLALKERGGFTLAEIDAVDRDTPADPRNPWAEPAWWLEMMDARRALTQELSGRP